MTVNRRTSQTGLEALRRAAATMPALAPLDPDTYAVGHALFEARSDQRELLTRWLETHLAARAGAGARVLSIGTGDGSVDARVAGALAGAREVSYDGVEPHDASGKVFLERLQSLPGVHARLAPVGFGEFSADHGPYDVVLAVHSLYYVPDLRAALDRALTLLAPGGELIVLHAPLSALNVLVGVLAPGHPQEFSEAVSTALGDSDVTRSRIEATLYLAPGDDPRAWRQVLDFTVQALVPDQLRPLVVAALRAASLPGRDLVLPHPIDAFVVTRRVDAGLTVSPGATGPGARPARRAPRPGTCAPGPAGRSPTLGQ